MSIGLVKIKDAPIHISDGNYSSKYPKASEFCETGIPFLSGNNIINGSIDETECKYISEELHSVLKKGHVQTDDVLITTRGNIGSTAIVPERLDDANINAQLVLLRADKSTLKPEYLKHIFATPEVTRQIATKLTGTALKQLPIGNLKEIEIPLPPLETQKHIAAVLDKVEELKQKRQQTLDLADEYLRATFLDLFGDPITNPKGWPVRKLSEVTVKTRNWTNKDCLEEFVYIDIGSLNNKEIEFNEPILALEAPSRAKQVSQVDDVLVSTVRPNLNNVALIRTQAHENLISSTGFCVLRPNKNETNSGFLFALVKSKSFVLKMMEVQSGANYPAVKNSDVFGLEIGLPPKTEQDKFEQIVKKVEALKSKMQTSETEIEHLAKSLSQKAFRGELTSSVKEL